MSPLSRQIAPIGLLVAVVLGGAALAYVRSPSRAPGDRAYAVETSVAPYSKVLRAPDGTRIVLRSRPTRIVALSTAVEEILVALGGAEILAGVSSFARGRYSNIVEEVRDIETTVVGTNPAQILRLRPDLVLVSSYTEPRARAALERLGLPVFPMPDPDSFASIESAIELAGRMFDAELEAARVLSAMRERLAAVARDARRRAGGDRPGVIYLSGGADLWTAGAGTVIGEIIELAGARNLAAESGIEEFRKLDRDRLLRMNPPWVLLEDAGEAGGDPLDHFRRDAVLGRLDAVRAGRVARIPARSLTAVSHHVVDAVEALSEALRREVE